MTTIVNVADRAGVSIKTVSRVMNNEPNVSPRLRAKVEEAVRALDYTPSQAARRMGGNRSFLIGFLTETARVGYATRLQCGAIRRCRELDHHLVVDCATGDQILPAAERLVKALRPDGLLLCPPFSDNAPLRALLKSLAVPVACVASADRDEGFHVFTGEREAGRAMTRHLIDLGHVRIAIVRGRPGHEAAEARFEGYRDAMQGAGLKVDAKFVVQGYFELQSGIAAGRALLSLAERPTAIFATNDEMALGVMIVAGELGIDIPSQLSLAGFDDTEMSGLLWPSLTTVRQPVEEMGWSAVDALVGGAASPRLVELPFELKFRASTAAAPG